MCFENESKCISKAFELPGGNCAVKKNNTISELHAFIHQREREKSDKLYILVFSAAK